MSDEHSFDNDFGPVVYLVVEFEDGTIGSAGFRKLLELVDAHIIRVLDMEFISKRTDGTVELIDAHNLIADEAFDLGMFDGARSGLLGPDDFAEVGASMKSGSVSAVVIYEELAILPVISAWSAGGATLLGEGTIDVGSLVTALDQTDADVR